MQRFRRVTLIAAVPVLVAVTAIIAVPSAGAAGTANAVSQFSAKANPHGKWSYQSNGTLLTQSVPNDFCGPKKLSGWLSSESTPHAAVFANKTSGTIACTDNDSVFVPPETLGLDPQAIPDVEVVWTVKKAGTYSVQGNFSGIDNAPIGHTVEVLHNGTSIYSNTITSFGETDSFSLSVPAAKADTISFEVVSSNQGHQSTGLQATIAPT